MTIFHFSGVLFALLLAGCSAISDENMPESDSELGRIARVSNFSDRTAALMYFAEQRLGDQDQLRRELLIAGFELTEDTEEGCENYYWRGRDRGMLFYSVMIVNVCGETVQTNSGSIAP